MEEVERRMGGKRESGEGKKEEEIGGEKERREGEKERERKK